MIPEEKRAPASGDETLLSYIVGRYAETCRPITTLIELTYQCNLRCTHCYVPGYDRPDGDLLSLTEIRQVVDEMLDLGVLRITLSGGELMVRPDWLDIVRYIKEKGFLLTLLTNGTMVDRATASRLAAIRPEIVEISLYGSDAASYDRVTGVSGSFEAFSEALRVLKEHGIRFVLKPIVIRQNVDDYSAMIRFAEANGYDLRLKYSPCLVSRPGAPWACDGYRLSDDHMTELMTISEDTGLSQPFSPNPCRIGTRAFVVGPYGGVRPCVIHPEEAGNVRDQSLSEIWTGSAFFAELRGLSESDFRQCTACGLQSYCQPCIAMNRLDTGSITIPSPENCRIARNRATAASRSMAKSQSSP